MSSVAVVRLFTVSFGCLGLAWGGLTFPHSWQDLGVEQVAQRVIAGEEFSFERLDELTPRLVAIEQDPICRPAALRSDAIVRLRIAEIALNAGSGDVDERLAGSHSAIVRSLACSPSDSFLWFALFWVNGSIEGFNPAQLRLLRLSYALGPNEGWIIVKRNRLAMALFTSLPPDLAEQVQKEFAKLFEPGLVQYAVDIFLGPGWPIHDQLLAWIADTPLPQRQDFANLLLARGAEINVPGVVTKTRVEERPWL